MKKRNKLLVAFLSLFMLSCAFENSFAQSFEWNEPTWSQDEYTNSTQKGVTDHEGNVIVVYNIVGEVRIQGEVFNSNVAKNGTWPSQVIVKFNSAGNLLWAIQPYTNNIATDETTKNNNSAILDITVDENNAIYITGYTKWDHYLRLGKSLKIENFYDQNYMMFLAKISPDGQPQWGDTYRARRGDAIVAAKGFVYVYGSYSWLQSCQSCPNNFSFSDNVSITNQNPNTPDIFVAKFRTSNGAPIWAENTIYSDDFQATDMVIDPVNDALYITGTIEGFAKLTEHGSKLDTLFSWGADSDVYYAKYDAITGEALWARTAGGWGSENPVELAVDNDYLYLVMDYDSDYILMSSWIKYNSDEKPIQSMIARLSKVDLFPIKLHNVDDAVKSIAVKNNALYLGGNYGNEGRMFIRKLNQNFSWLWTTSIINTKSDIANISIDPRGFNETVNFCGNFRYRDLIMGNGPGGTVLFDNNSTQSGFVAQLNFLNIQPFESDLDLTIDLNPTTASNISFTLIATSVERVDVTLVNELTGAIEYQNYFNVVEGENRFSISLNRLEKGTYSLVAQSPSGSTSKHVVIE